MNDSGRLREHTMGARSSPRVQSLRDIAISYEGQDEEIIVKPPNLSERGMFINTSRSFPEGAVLNLRFTLALTGAEIQTRCEVRYCQPGVGVGVEFIGLSPMAEKTIEREIQEGGAVMRRARPRTRSRKAISRGAKERRS